MITIETKTLKIVGQQTMHCGSCETTVEFAIRQLPGVQRVKANYKTQEINLTLNPQALHLERVCQELDEIGYQIAEVKRI